MSERNGALAGMIGPAMFAFIAVVLTVLQYNFLVRLGWEPVGVSDVPWPSALALGPYGSLQILNFVLFGIMLIVFAVSAWKGYTRKDGTRKRHFHYACGTRRQRGKEACSYSRTPNARKIEVEVWEAVKAVLLDPERLERGLNAYLEAEKENHGGDPEKEARVFTDRIAEVDRKRAAYQDLVADGLMEREELRAKLDALSHQKAAAEERTTRWRSADARSASSNYRVRRSDELKAKLEALNEARETAKGELAELAGKRERLEAMERDRDLILESHAALAPEALEALSPEERRKVYGILNLTVEPLADGGLKISGAFGEELVWEDVETSTR
jgi:hypothetical protein